MTFVCQQVFEENLVPDHLIHFPLGLASREIRSFLGMTQAEFAEKLGLSKIAISQWDTGRRRPDKDSMNKIAELLNISYLEVFNLFSSDWVADTYVLQQSLKAGSVNLEEVFRTKLLALSAEPGDLPATQANWPSLDDDTLGALPGIAMYLRHAREQLGDALRMVDRAEERLKNLMGNQRSGRNGHRSPLTHDAHGDAYAASDAELAQTPPEKRRGGQRQQQKKTG